MRRTSFFLFFLILSLLIIHHTVQSFGLFPETWNFGLRGPLDEFKSWVVINRQNHWLFVGFFDPLSTFLDLFIRRVEALLLWLPWPVLSLAIFLIAQKFADLRVGIVATLCLWAMGFLGLWDESMATLALMLASVGVALAVGLPLGVWTAQNARAEKFLRPVLDGMQTPLFISSPSSSFLAWRGFPALSPLSFMRCRPLFASPIWVCGVSRKKRLRRPRRLARPNGKFCLR